MTSDVCQDGEESNLMEGKYLSDECFTHLPDKILNRMIIERLVQSDILGYYKRNYKIKN